MKTLNKTGLVLFLSLCALQAQAQLPDQKPDIPLPEGVEMKTYTFAVREEGELKLDVYRDKSFEGQTLPVFMYVYGGAWSSGSRKDAPFMPKFAKRGYAGVCIEYRLRLKGQEYADSTGFGAQFQNAIRTAVEDVYDATAFLIGHAQELGIDPEKIVISGGSAGATNSIMAEYWLCNEDPLATERLPKDFGYAAVVSFAGGVWKIGMEDPAWKRTPCPHMFVHGDKDQLVPFNKNLIPASNYGAFGPEYLLPLLHREGVSYQLIKSVDADHFMAGGPDYTAWGVDIDYTETVFNFLDRTVFHGEKVAIETVERPYDNPRTLEWMFQELAKKLEEMQKNQQNNAQ